MIETFEASKPIATAKPIGTIDYLISELDFRANGCGSFRS
jgi:hypothetical protein